MSESAAEVHSEAPNPTLLPRRTEAATLLHGAKPLVPAKIVDPHKATSAIAEAWKLSGKYNVKFDAALVLVVGQQSAGKTSFVERYLGYAFSVVSHGMATKRPSVLTLLPAQAGSEDEVKVTQEFLDGTVSPEEVFAGVDALTKLNQWVVDKNAHVAKEKLFITICTPKCTTPRRVMDLPGVRASDEEEAKGVNDAIIEMISDAIGKPNSVVVCLADAAVEPANDNMVKLFRDRGTGMSSFRGRLVLVLTKADNWFASTRRDEQVQEHLDRWKKEFYGLEPMLMGSTFDKAADTKNANVRNCEYSKADQREQMDIAKFRLDVMKGPQGNRGEYWDKKVGFKHVQSLVKEMSLRMDMCNLPRIIIQIEQRKHQVKLKLDKTKASRETTDPEFLKRGCSQFVSALLADTSQSLTRPSGPSLSVQLSSSQQLQETAKTLLQEEEEFMQAAVYFSSDSMKAAWSEQKMSNIDYSRADEQAPDEFSAFHKRVLADRNFTSQVAQSEDALLPGAALPRTANFFGLISRRYMHFDKDDVSRIKNACTMSPDMPFVKDSLQQIFVVGNTKAAKMRDVTMYLVQKTSYLMTQGLTCAFSGMKKNDRYRDLIEALAGGASVDYVFDVIRKGFIGYLLVHAQHAYLSSVSDHNQFMHQVGGFYHSGHNLHEDRESTAQLLREAMASEVCRGDGESSAHRLLEAVKSEVRREIKWGQEQSELQDGINEGLSILSGHAVHPQVPGMISNMLEDMKAKGILDSKDRGLHKLLGMTVVVFAVLAPQFSTAVIMRCMSGLLGSLNSIFYRHAYEESILEELTKVFISGDLGERVKALQQREDDLKEEYDDLCHAVSELQKLR
ncbi:DRP1E [Symbiodinium sp. CCMP2592]|nr:DRP1E [Symbiodinium sp. CCMP2592]